MDSILGFVISSILLIYSIYRDMFIGIPLTICFFIFCFIAYKRGYSFKEIMKMSYKGGKKSFIVSEVLILIGMITASWMASGTVQGMVYYGIEFMNPRYFVVYAFMICTVISFILGTAFGTVGTVGLSLMVMAKSGGLNSNIAAGAIVAGAYFGDRCSPMSSSAHLIANLTETDLYENIKNMFKTAIIPYGISLFIYIFISTEYPLNFTQNKINEEIIKNFNISFLVLLPAILILALSVFKVNVKISMSLSIVLAFFISCFYQGIKIQDFMKYLFFGYSIPKEIFLSSIIKGGGVISMLKAIFMTFVSCSLAGLLDSAGFLKGIHSLFDGVNSRCRLFIATAIISVLTAAFGGNQSIAIVLTIQIMKDFYDKMEIDKYQFAVNIENTAVVLSPMVPWNISGVIPAMTLGVSSLKYLPYAFYIYFIPIINMIFIKIISKTSRTKSVS